MNPPRECPCHSKRRYKECCAPAHQGLMPAPTPEALMRSRYSAFALGLGDYLVKTLSRDHEDRSHDASILARELSHAREKQRFLALRIESAAESADTGEVVFHARIFERGTDKSFGERSTFVRENGEWRYASGEPIPYSE